MKKFTNMMLWVFVASSLVTVVCFLTGNQEIAKEFVAIPGGMILIGFLTFGFLSN